MANIRELKWLHRWNNMQLQGRRKFGDWNEKERKFIELINWLHATCIKRRTWHFGRNNNKSLTFALAVTSDTLFLFHWAAFEGSQHWWLLFTAELSSLFISLFKFRTKKRGFSCVIVCLKFPLLYTFNGKTFNKLSHNLLCNIKFRS